MAEETPKFQGAGRTSRNPLCRLRIGELKLRFSGCRGSVRLYHERTGTTAMDYISRREATRLVLLGTTFVAARIVPVAAETLPLAIKGYDPVAYFTLGAPARGLPEIAYEWDEHRYLFSRLEHRELFTADPVHYAPQFANFCAMALSKGELDEANPENWLISDGKLYVFGKAKPMGPELFQQDLAGNVAKANENRHLIFKR
jgi:hypothetical protein